MCNFLSALVLKNGDVLHHPMLDSHADLVRYFKLPDTDAHIQHFAKVELTPVDWADAATWNFRVDEEVLPVWWADVASAVEGTLRSRAAGMILKDGDHDLIVDGCWIVAGTAKVRDVRSGRIILVQDSAQISNVGGSAQISGVWDSAQISNVGGSAQISGVRGSAQISGVRDSAQISGVRGSAQISNVGDSAQISNVGGLARISNVGGLARISNVWGSATLDASAKAHVIVPVDAVTP